MHSPVIEASLLHAESSATGIRPSVQLAQVKLEVMRMARLAPTPTFRIRANKLGSRTC
jgi:hypothetical protein